MKAYTCHSCKKTFKKRVERCTKCKRPIWEVLCEDERKYKEWRAGVPTEKPRGYGGIPGTGPEKEKCKTCNKCTVELNAEFKNTYLCLVNILREQGSFIRLKSPACNHWEKIDA